MAVRSVKSPELLVSVRSPAEAIAAIAGGCDLLDIKEPHRGSLGAADPETILAICEAIHRSSTAPPISIALGELTEWPGDRKPPQLAPRVQYVKLGLSQCRFVPDWEERWARLRDAFQVSSPALKWICVHYVDADAGSPHADELLQAAEEAGCHGLLVDTFSKDGRRLFDFIEPQALIDLRNRAGSLGLTFAVAGSLRAQDLPRLFDVSPDIVAVRGGVCSEGSRIAAVSEDAVRAFHRELDLVFGRQTARPGELDAKSPIVAISGAGP